MVIAVEIAAASKALNSVNATSLKASAYVYLPAVATLTVPPSGHFREKSDEAVF